MMIKSDISRAISGFGKILLYPFKKSSTPFLRSEISIISIIVIAGLIGILRNLLEVWIGGKWANMWFSMSPDIFFTMFFYPVFLTFFPTVILYNISCLFRLKTEIREILRVFFFLQVFHLLIPFFDMLAALFNIPHSYLFPVKTYIKLIFSPLAFTPFIILFTRPTSLGIDIAWFFTAVVMLKYYLKTRRYSFFRAIISLGITFYIIYMSIYPNYTFFLNERLRGDNFHFGLFFAAISISSVLIYKSILSGKNELRS